MKNIYLIGFHNKSFKTCVPHSNILLFVYTLNPNVNACAKQWTSVYPEYTDITNTTSTSFQEEAQ